MWQDLSYDLQALLSSTAQSDPGSLCSVVSLRRHKTFIWVCLFLCNYLSLWLLGSFVGFDLIRCEEPGVPNYGYKIQDDGHYANTFVLYSCNPGYSLHGSSTLTCLSGDRRVWDKPLPSCVGEYANTCLNLLKVYIDIWIRHSMIPVIMAVDFFIQFKQATGSN